MNLKEFIKSKRETLSNSSLTTYTSILRSLYKKVFGNEDVNFSKFDEYDKILDYLESLTPNKRKTILSALVIVTNNKKYREQMLNDIKDYNKEISKQEKTESQEQNWITQDELKNLFETLKKNANFIYKKNDVTSSDLQILQNYIIISLFTLIAPRRSKDYVDFKIKNIDKEKDNYIDKNKFIFNSYKTSKTYGRQEVIIPKELSTIINKWIKINPTDYLLFDVNMNKLTAVKLNQRFNKLFGDRKISVNMLRHSFLTDKYADTIKQKNEMDKTMSNMGSSINMIETYVKKD